MMMSLGGFTALIVISLAGAALLMIAILAKFIQEFKKNEIW